MPAVPSVLPLAIPGMEGPADVEERIRSLEASVRRFAAYEPECVACLAGPLGGRTVAEGTERWSSTLSAHWRRGGVTAGVRVGFEPIHASQRDEAGFVNSLAHADEVLAAGRRAGASGSCFDTYHLWDDPGVLAVDRGRTPAASSASTSPTGPRPTAATASSRGRASAASARWSRALAAAGWDGALDVEIFSTPELFWGLPVDEAARRAHDAAVALLPQERPPAADPGTPLAPRNGARRGLCVESTQRPVADPRRAPARWSRRARAQAVCGSEMVGDPKQARRPLERLLECDQKRLSLRGSALALCLHDGAHGVITRRREPDLPGKSG